MSTLEEGHVASPRAARLEQAAAASILERIDQVVAKGRARIIADHPAYERQPPDEIADVTELLYSNFRMLARAMAGHRVSREQLDYVAEHVRRRVRSNIPLDAVIEAYRTGMNVFWEECTAEVAARGLSRDAAVSLARKTSEAMDTLTTHAAASYVREESHLRSVGAKAALDLLDAILRGDAAEDQIDPHGIPRGLDPQGDLVLVICRVGAGDAAPASALLNASGAVAEHLSSRRTSPLLAIREQAIVALVPAEPMEILADRLAAAQRALIASAGISIYCGLSAPCSGFQQVPDGFEQASLAVSLATDDVPIVSLTMLPAIQHLLTGATARTRAHLLEKARAITRLKRSSAEMLARTVRGFADADMNISRAAKEMHIHENTLRYRLRRIHEQTGHDPHSFRGLVELLCLVEVAGADAVTENSPL